MDWLATTGTLIGIAGGLAGTTLGVYNLLRDRRWGQRHLIVKLEDWGAILDEDVEFITVAALNVGFRPMILQQVGLLVPDGRALSTLEPVIPMHFPMQLSAGNSCDITMSAYHVATAVEAMGYGTGVQLRGYYRDALGKVYRSAPRRFDPEQAITRAKRLAK